MASISKEYKEIIEHHHPNGLSKKDNWDIARAISKLKRHLNKIDDADFIAGIREFVVSDDLGA